MIKILKQIVDERRNQNKKWGEQNHHPVEWLAILGKWLCDQGKHQWSNYRRATDRYVYFLRKCDSCGVRQRQKNGNLGDGSWCDIDAPFRWDWEREEFENSVLVADI